LDVSPYPTNLEKTACRPNDRNSIPWQMHRAHAAVHKHGTKPTFKTLTGARNHRNHETAAAAS
jgi:hypothetical protein